MVKVSVFGKGNMGSAIGQNFIDAGNQTEYITKDQTPTELGDIVVFAVPYPAVADIIEKYRAALAGKIIVDITNPVDFNTFDDLVVPADSSAAAEIAAKLPDSKIIKAFNTTFAATLATKKVAGQHQTTVLMASDDPFAKKQLEDALTGCDLKVIDAGSLKRARELEAMGFLQISLASAEKINWTGGFGIFN